MKMLIFLVLALTTSSVLATDVSRGTRIGIVGNYYSTEGVALAISQAQIAKDWSSDRIQWGIGMGHFDGKDALSGGLGRRFGKYLLNFTIGTEEGKIGVGAGVNGRF